MISAKQIIERAIDAVQDNLRVLRSAFVPAGVAIAALAVFGAIVFFAQDRGVQAFTCTSNPCPYDEKTGEFIGYPKPWPPGCVYIIPGLPGGESGKATSTGNYKFNPSDRSTANTTKPQCYPEDVSKYGFTYYGRGHRMYNVGTYIDKSGYAYKYKADGTFLAAVCQVPEKCGTNSSSSAQAATDAAEAAAAAAQASREESPNPVGWIDSVSCDGIKGWAFDADNPGAAVTVHVYVDGKAGSGGKLLTSGTASEERADVNQSFNLTGVHAFTVRLPDSVRDGKSHSVYVYGIDTNGGQNLLLGGSGKTFTCTGATGVVSTNPTAVPVVDKTAPVGWFDSATSTKFEGWAFDADNTSAVIDVHFYADAPVAQGGKLLGYAKTNQQRDDINNLYKISGTHGFMALVMKATLANGAVSNEAGTITIPLALQDGKSHLVYAYAIDSNGTKNPLAGGSPKSVVFGAACVPTSSGTGAVAPAQPVVGSPGGSGGTSGCGSSSGGGGVGGASNRHVYLTPCDGTGLAGKDDPAIAIIAGKDGSLKATVDTKNIPDAKVTVGGQVVSGTNFNLEKGQSVVVTTSKGTFTADSDMLTPGDNVSILVPMPCIRIGYADVGVGSGASGSENCSKEGTEGTCYKELDGFLNWEAIQAAGVKDEQLELYYRVDGGKYDTKGWKFYDWKKCGQFSAHCIPLAGKGVLKGVAKIISTSGGFTAGSYSLTNSKAFDSEKGEF